MNSFEKISKMNLADLDRPNGEKEDWEDVQTTEEDNQSQPVTVGEVEDGKVSLEEAEKIQPEIKKQMREPEGEHYFVDAKVTEKEIIAFLFAHTYRQPLMLIAMIIAVVWPITIIVRRQTNMYMAIILAIFILLVLPFSTWNRGKKMAKDNPTYQDTFHYMVDEWGLHLELEKDCVDVEWNRVKKLIFLKSVTILYTGKVSAFLIPTVAMDGQTEQINAFIKKMKRK